LIDANAVLLPVRVRPRRSLLRNGLIATAVGGVTIFAALYWLAIAQGSWLRVLVLQAIVVAVAAVLWLRFRAGFVEVRDGTITKQPFGRRVVVDRSLVASTVIARVSGTNATDITPQLVALGRDGECVFRMRGIFWSLESMTEIAEAIGAPVLHETEPMTSREFYRTYSGVAYWYEGKPWLAAAGVGLALGASLIIMSWLLGAIGASTASSAGL